MLPIFLTVALQTEYILWTSRRGRALATRALAVSTELFKLMVATGELNTAYSRISFIITLKATGSIMIGLRRFALG